MRPGWAPDVLTLFVELAALPSPSGEERAVADRVLDYIRALGLEADEDDAGSRIGSSMGNILCRIPPSNGAGGTPLFLCAHLDTVPLEGPVEPVVGEDEVVRNAGGTILGAENKAAVASMREAAARLLENGHAHGGLELLFTPMEEVGLRGAAAFDEQRLAARVGYVYDHAGAVGEVILGAPYQCKLDVRLHGRAAHSGMYPEEGRSAIAAAARAIADLRLGRLDEETTANLGEIIGGTARNIVPEWCSFAAEARCHNETKLGELVQEMLETITFAAQLGDCDVETQVDPSARGYRFKRDDGLVRCEVEGEPCVAYPELTGPVVLGDEVIVNVQARDLALGSGGFDVLHANLKRGLGLEPPPGAHVMKLPYTPLQYAAHHAEESAALADELGGLPVVCCSLHSQLAPVCAGLAGSRVAYVQLAGGALPLALSDTVRALRERQLLAVSVAVGPCFGGGVGCGTGAFALLWGAAEAFDAVVCAIGPGIVGTASRLGHGGLAAADAANAASALGGAPVLAARISSADERDRHRGVSHHTEAVLALCAGRVTVAWPAGRENSAWVEPRKDVEASGWRRACAGLPLAHMGRGPDDDPWFFESAFAAGRLARGLAR